MSHLLTLDTITADDMFGIFAHARAVKVARSAMFTTSPVIPGRTLALLFEKPSLRTRISFEVAAREMGAQSLYLSPAEVGLGTRESVADVARVLSGYVHGVVLRTFLHTTVEDFARYSAVPVINGLTDLHHPCQGLTDVFTVDEELGGSSGKTLAYFGDGNNVAHSLMQAAAKCGMHVRICTPASYEPDAGILAGAQRDARMHGGSVTLLSEPQEAAAGAHVLYTDVWTSMGQEGQRELRREVFGKYQLNARLLALAAPDAIVMHPLPAHRGEEITDDVLDGQQSRVFVQAENRLHVQKAILRATLAEGLRASLTA